MKKTKTKPKINPHSKLLQKADGFFSEKEEVTFYLGLFLTLLFGLLLFEPKVTIGGDDSIYINRAYNFLHDGIFPTFQAPLYSIILAAIIAITGIKLIILKFFSFLCMEGFYWFTFRLFKNYLSGFLLFIFILLISTSASLLSYASYTYSEAFYLFIQSIFLFYFDKKFIRGASKDYKPVLITSLLVLLLFLTRNIGLVALLTVLTYFLIQKDWKTALQLLGTFVVFYGVYHILKISIWDIPEVQATGQGSTLLLKNSFKPELGKETPHGFLLRFAGNSVYYLGYHLFAIFGLPSGDNFLLNAAIAVIVYFIFFRNFVYSFKKSSFWTFIGIYVLMTILVIFLALQTYWSQERLIITTAPILLIFLLQSLYETFNTSLKKVSMLFLVFIAVLLLFNVKATFQKVPVQTKAITKYLQGDNFYGFPEDWQNYLAMAKWSSENLPKEAFVACRKPGMAFIYGHGKNFHGIWRVSSSDPDVLYKQLKDAGVTHVILASLRTNPEDDQSPLIKTVRNYLEIINEAYPDKLKLVHKTGEKWPSYLYQLN